MTLIFIETKIKITCFHNYVLLKNWNLPVNITFSMPNVIGIWMYYEIHVQEFCNDNTSFIG